MPVITVSEAPNIAQPNGVLCTSQGALVLDTKSDTAVRVLDYRDGSTAMLLTFDRFSELPLGAAWSVSKDMEDDSVFWIFDLRNSVMHQVTMSNALRVTGAVRLRSASRLANSVSVGRRGFLATGLLPLSRMILLDPDGAFFGAIGLPPAGPGDVPIEVRNHALQGKILAHRSTQTVVLSALRASTLWGFGLDGNVRWIASAPDSIPTVFDWVVTNGHAVAAPGPAAQYGYLDISDSPDYLLGLFSGERLDESRGVPAAERVDMFDWSGRLRYSFRLPDNEKLLAACLGTSGKAIFGITAAVPRRFIRIDVSRLLSNSVL